MIKREYIYALRWEAQVVTEIMARVAVAPVPVVAFKKLEGGILMQACSAHTPARQPRWRNPL